MEAALSHGGGEVYYDKMGEETLCIRGMVALNQALPIPVIKLNIEHNSPKLLSCLK